MEKFDGMAGTDHQNAVSTLNASVFSIRYNTIAHRIVIGKSKTNTLLTRSWVTYSLLYIFALMFILLV
jgi:hypothetical protein